MSKHTEWATALSTARTDYEFLSEIYSYGITAIELSVREWECKNIDWSGLSDNAKKAGVALWSYHLPFGDLTDISSTCEDNRQKALEFLFSLIDKACEIGIKRFIIHPSYEPIEDDERAEKMACAKRSLAALADYADKYGAVICVEDLPRSCLGHDVAEMCELVSADDRLRVCFDVNHLLDCFGCTHADFVSALGDKIITVHMSDYDFVDEKHFFCGNGLIDWDELIGLLEGIGYNGPFLYEGGFAPSARKPDVPFGTLDKARERQMNIRSFRGRNGGIAK